MISLLNCIWLGFWAYGLLYIACHFKSNQSELPLYLVRFEGRQLGESRGVFFCKSNSCKSGRSMQVLKDYAGEDEHQKKGFTLATFLLYRLYELCK